MSCFLNETHDQSYMISTLVKVIALIRWYWWFSITNNTQIVSSSCYNCSEFRFVKYLVFCGCLANVVMTVDFLQTVAAVILKSKGLQASGLNLDEQPLSDGKSRAICTLLSANLVGFFCHSMAYWPEFGWAASIWWLGLMARAEPYATYCLSTWWLFVP